MALPLGAGYPQDGKTPQRRTQGAGSVASSIRFLNLPQRFPHRCIDKIHLHNQIPALLAVQQVFFEQGHLRFREVAHRKVFQ